MTIIALILLLIVLVLAILLVNERRISKAAGGAYIALSQGMDDMQDCYDQDTLQYTETIEAQRDTIEYLKFKVESMEEPLAFHQQFCLPRLPEIELKNAETRESLAELRRKLTGDTK